MRFEFAGQPFPLALVDATVAGTPTVAVLDTGAESHVIGAWLARKIGLPLADTERTTRDAFGKTIAIRVAEGVPLEVVGFGPLPARPTMVIDVEFMEQLGIGLIVSPQYMVGAAEAIILDFPGEALWSEPEASAFYANRLNGRRLPTVMSCVDPSVPTGYMHYVLPAKVDGEDAALILDSGATTSGLDASSPAGRTLLARHPAQTAMAAAASGTHAMSKLPALVLTVGQASVVAPVAVHERENTDPVCPSDGQLGMPLLKDCVLVLSHTRAAGVCTASAEAR